MNNPFNCFDDEDTINELVDTFIEKFECEKCVKNCG